jgi:hypothetical protein
MSSACWAALDLTQPDLRSYNRQDDCQDRLQCYSLQLVSEMGATLSTFPFSGAAAAVYGGCH